MMQGIAENTEIDVDEIDTLSFLSFLPRRERPLLAGNLKRYRTFSFVIFVFVFVFVFFFLSFLFKMCTVGLYVSLCLMIFLCPFLHCKALRTAMYKRYINSIIIIIIIIIRCLSKNISLAESFQLPESLLSTERQL